MAFIIVLASGCEKEQQQDKDTETLENFSITDIYGTSYELESMLSEYNYLLFFGFATCCHWSQSSIPQINTIDSIYNDIIHIIGVEGSPTPDENDIREFIEAYNFDETIILRIDNAVLNYILYPDSILAFPSLLIIDSEKKAIYRQSGYLENTIDSITKYLE